jgi:hypothetical protein
VSRGILYLVWGDKVEAAVKRSIFSLKEFHPELDYEVRQLPPDSSPSKGLLEKSSMMDFSPFDETLFLDADTILLDRLDFGFGASAAARQLVSIAAFLCTLFQCHGAGRNRRDRGEAAGSLRLVEPLQGTTTAARERTHRSVICSRIRRTMSLVDFRVAAPAPSFADFASWQSTGFGYPK